MKLEEGEAKKNKLEEAFEKTKALVNQSGYAVFTMASVGVPSCVLRWRWLYTWCVLRCVPKMRPSC